MTTASVTDTLNLKSGGVECRSHSHRFGNVPTAHAAGGCLIRQTEVPAPSSTHTMIDVRPSAKQHPDREVSRLTLVTGLNSRQTRSARKSPCEQPRPREYDSHTICEIDPVTKYVPRRFSQLSPTPASVSSARAAATETADALSSRRVSGCGHFARLPQMTRHLLQKLGKQERLPAGRSAFRPTALTEESR